MSSTVNAPELREGMRKLVQSGYEPRALRTELQLFLDEKLAQLAAQVGIHSESGLTLVAVGALGRREFLPYSDVDLVLLHRGHTPTDIHAVAEGLWYPIWDANIHLDHAVRTPAELLEVTQNDLRAALGFVRHRMLAGDQQLYHDSVAPVLESWRQHARRRLPELLRTAQERWDTSGSVAHRAEPDLKRGKGGTRDAELLEALALAQLTDGIPALTQESPGGGFARAYRDLLDIRTQIRRVTGKGRDTLHAQDADEVAESLGYEDRFALARALSGMARTVQYCVEVGLRVATNVSIVTQSARNNPRLPLAEGVITRNGEILLAKEAKPGLDLMLRVAAASAVTGLPMSQATLARLAHAKLDTAWTKHTVHSLLTLLGAGKSTGGVIEALDCMGLWERIFPEWSAIRDLPPRDPIHVWTVDRHVVETVIQASALTTRVSRPDLLLMGALLHDLGKGREGNHSEVGCAIAEAVARRCGFTDRDVQRITGIVRHHLLLPVTALRRDVRDPDTIEWVLELLGHDDVMVELLTALTEADSLATGPGVWGEWKARLIGELATQCHHRLWGEEPISVRTTPEDRWAELLDSVAGTVGHADDLRGQVRTHWAGNAREGSVETGELVMVAPQSEELLSKVSAVLALHGLRCHHAEFAENEGYALAEFAVSPRFGSLPSAQLIRQDLLRSLTGQWDVIDAVTKRAQQETTRWTRGVPTVAVPTAPRFTPTRVLWLPGSQPGQILIEVRAADRIGLLARLTHVIAQAGLRIVEARVDTLGLSVVDVFVVNAGYLSREFRDQVEAQLMQVDDSLHQVTV